MSSDSNQNNPKRAPYVVRETPVPLPSYAGAHKGQASSSPASASVPAQSQQLQQSGPPNGRSLQDSALPAVRPPFELIDNSNTMSSSGRQLRNRRPAPPAPPASEPPSKKRKATSSSKVAPVEPAQEQLAQPIPPPLPQQDGEGQGQPQPSKEMPILRPSLQPGSGASPPNNDNVDEIYRMPPLPPYLPAPPRICEPATNYRGWTIPLEFSYKMNVHPLTFYGSFDIWFEQIQKMAEASNCSAELNTRIGKFPDPGTVEAFICQTRFLNCWRILHGTISGSYWAYMRVLGYSRIPVFMGAPDGDPEEEEEEEEEGGGGGGGGGGDSGGWLQCQWQPQPSDCVYFALEVKKRVMVPNSDRQPRYQTMRMVEEVRSAKVSDYPSLQQYKEGMGWLKEVLNGMILKGDRQVCESMYDRKPDWAPEWPEVQPENGGQLEPPWALKGNPIRVEEAFGTSAGTGPNGKAGHQQQQQQQQQLQIDPRLDPGSLNQQGNNHAIARLAPMSGASSSDGGDDFNNYGDGSAVNHDYSSNSSNSNNLIFLDGTTSNTAAVTAAEVHGLGSSSVGGGGPSTRSHGQHRLFEQHAPNDHIGNWN